MNRIRILELVHQQRLILLLKIAPHRLVFAQQIPRQPQLIVEIEQAAILFPLLPLVHHEIVFYPADNLMQKTLFRESFLYESGIPRLRGGIAASPALFLCRPSSSSQIPTLPGFDNSLPSSDGCSSQFSAFSR